MVIHPNGIRRIRVRFSAGPFLERLKYALFIIILEGIVTSELFLRKFGEKMQQEFQLYVMRHDRPSRILAEQLQRHLLRTVRLLQN